MNYRHQVFITEMLRHGDKEIAYTTAYPKAQGKSVVSAANRLLSTTEVAAAITQSQMRIRKQVEEELKEQIKADFLTLERMKQLLTDMAEGRTETPRHIRTAEGVQTVTDKPAHWHRLKAIDSFCRLTGQFRKAEKEIDEPESKPAPFRILIDGMEQEEYLSKSGGLREAYFDDDEEGQKHLKLDSIDNQRGDRFMAYQQRRAMKKDEERKPTLTPEYRGREQTALAEFKNRPADQSYFHFDAVLSMLWTNYSHGRAEKNLLAYKALQKMVGTRFLPHRHRWEAELQAGW